MKKRNRRKRSSVSSSPAVGWEVAHVFFGVGTVPLSDGLIDKLVGRGWPRIDLENFRKRGAVYSVQRDSVVFPAGVML
jgi:hypothetical protein